MTRYEDNTRKHKADKQYIYEAKMTSALIMESNQRDQCACMCLEWMFCDCILVCFKLKLKYELIKLG